MRRWVGAVEEELVGDLAVVDGDADDAHVVVEDDVVVLEPGDVEPGAGDGSAEEALAASVGEECDELEVVVADGVSDGAFDAVTVDGEALAVHGLAVLHEPGLARRPRRR